jgi:hypothetical protein
MWRIAAVRNLPATGQQIAISSATKLVPNVYRFIGCAGPFSRSL